MSFFHNNSRFTIDEGLYCQKDFDSGEFEKEYVNIRTKEGRMYDDTTVAKLPTIAASHPLYHEWKIRKNSADKLITQLKEEMCGSILEVGCGNGWLINYIQDHITIPAYGIDVGNAELKQAVRRSNGRAAFAYGDVTSNAFDGMKVDTIIMAACAQYFSDLRMLIGRLMPMLNNNGSIHIIDTPFYKSGSSIEARSRSAEYFKSKGSGGMQSFYFHHEIDDLKDLGAEFLYRPNRIKKLLGNPSPFPWVRIRKD